MFIEQEVKLDFSDVLLRPKRSTLSSRKDVSIERQFKFYHSPKTWTVMHMMTGTKASCGTCEMADTLSPYTISIMIHNYYVVQDYKTFSK